MIPELTRHAQVRWKERFSHLDIESEWDSALPVTKKMKDGLKGDIWCKQPYLMYLLSTNGVIFVYDKTGFVITILRAGYTGRVVVQNNKAWWAHNL